MEGSEDGTFERKQGCGRASLLRSFYTSHPEPDRKGGQFGFPNQDTQDVIFESIQHYKGCYLFNAQLSPTSGTAVNAQHCGKLEPTGQAWGTCRK